MTPDSQQYPLPPLTSGRILGRYKRFLADIELDDGSIVTAHCPNTGSMTGCWEKGAPVQLSHSDNPGRKLAWTLERVDMGEGWVGVNTARTNQIVHHLVNQRLVPGLTEFDELQREPGYNLAGFGRSRFDLLLRNHKGVDWYIEVKNTSLILDDRILFPDAVTTRGRKHLQLLAHAVGNGFRGIILFALNRPEGKVFSPARHIDPDYADTLRQVLDAGVEVLAVRLHHTDIGVGFGGLVTVEV